MGRGKSKAAVSQKTITSAGFFPMLPKPAVGYLVQAGSEAGSSS